MTKFKILTNTQWNKIDFKFQEAEKANGIESTWWFQTG